jgi:histidine triad (HIT) family protein
MTGITHAPDGYRCPFCRVVAGDFDASLASQPEHVLFRWPEVTALLAAHQYRGNLVNALVITNAHFENVYDIPAELGTPILAATSLLARAIKSAFACDGISTRQHNEPAGSQDVWHYHQHVTARYTGDRLYTRLTTEKTLWPDGERTELAERLREAIRGFDGLAPEAGAPNVRA